MGICSTKLRTQVREFESEAPTTGYKSSLHYLALQPGHSGLFEEFLLYFSNEDIGKRDLAISEQILRVSFHKGLSSFYNKNIISCLDEIKMIAYRKICLRVCNARYFSISELTIFSLCK